jgi:UDP-N-acetylmuramoyl-L-alanyl-D-glutamate--2,6-diaminopimelate ligase
MLEKWISEFKASGLWLSGDASGAVDRIVYDSRALQKAPATEKIVFFARKGAARDGHDFLKEIESIASLVAFVVEKASENFKPKAPVVLVRDATLAMALATKSLYRNPTGEAFTVAVTGTNGKTTTTFLIQSLLNQALRRCARVGTIETQFENLRMPSELTTPDFTILQKTFSDLRSRGADAFVFEASSHALDQRRLLGLEIDAAIFTNLTPEHLDYHKNMENYFLAKKRLFTEILLQSSKKRRVAILPEDGAYGSRLAEELRQNKDLEVFTWAYEGKPTDHRILIEGWDSNLRGSEIVVSGCGFEKFKMNSQLIGQYNVENILGLLCLAAALKLDSKVIQKSLDDQSPVRGRLERVDVPVGSVFVDYAHTPDALENVLLTLRPLTAGKLKVVFGCGGDRDRQKRPKMGAIAELYADEIFVTSDNPRTEDPEKIIHEILTGIQKIKPTHVDGDRKLAIEKSLQGLKENDVVLIAGKGHEDYQILGTARVPFDDREIVRGAVSSSKGDKRCFSS